MDWDHLESLRRHEGEIALSVLRSIKPPPARLIEIGGGSGWQAQEFAKAGYDVLSFDIASTEYAGNRIFPVETYDGHHLPVEAGLADIVYSSNVLEHIPHVVAFQEELKRVLKPDGVALHLLPTATWRLWTSITHYPWVAKKTVAHLARRRPASPTSPAAGTAEPGRHAGPGGLAALRNNLIPPRHGEFGNVLSEHYYFSRWRWQRMFRQTGWRIARYTTNGLPYTGHSLLGPMLPLTVRRRLSSALGSACHVFLLTKS